MRTKTYLQVRSAIKRRSSRCEDVLSRSEVLGLEGNGKGLCDSEIARSFKGNCQYATSHEALRMLIKSREQRKLRLSSFLTNFCYLEIFVVVIREEVMHLGVYLASSSSRIQDHHFQQRICGTCEPCLTCCSLEECSMHCRLSYIMCMYQCMIMPALRGYHDLTPQHHPNVRNKVTLQDPQGGAVVESCCKHNLIYQMRIDNEKLGSLESLKQVSLT